MQESVSGNQNFPCSDPDPLCFHEDALPSSDSDSLPSDSDSLPSDREALPSDHHSLPSDADSLPSDHHSLPSDPDPLPSDLDPQSSEADSVSSDEEEPDAIAQNKVKQNNLLLLALKLKHGLTADAIEDISKLINYVSEGENVARSKFLLDKDFSSATVDACEFHHFAPIVSHTFTSV